MLRWLFPLVVAGCSYNPSSAGDDTPDTPIDGGLVEPSTCRESGTIVCLDFETESDPMMQAVDGSGFAHRALAKDVDIAPTNVASSTGGIRDTRTAFLRTDFSSEMRIASSPKLDLTTAFTMEMFVVRMLDVPSGFRYWLLDSSGQYFMSIGDNDQLRCGINNGGQQAEDQNDVPVGDGRWHHVACTYNGADLTLYVDGNVVACRTSVGAIVEVPGDTTVGMRTNGNFNEHFLGYLDNVHLYDKTLAAGEICRIATGSTTGCNATCPPPAETGKGGKGHSGGW